MNPFVVTISNQQPEFTSRHSVIDSKYVTLGHVCHSFRNHSYYRLSLELSVDLVTSTPIFKRDLNLDTIL